MQCCQETEELKSLGNSTMRVVKQLVGEALKRVTYAVTPCAVSLWEYVWEVIKWKLVISLNNYC